MKKIVIFYHHIREYGGIERNVLGLARCVQSHGLKPVLLCYYDKVGMRRHLPEMEVIEMGDHLIPWVKAGRLRNTLAKLAADTEGLPFFIDTKSGFYGALARLNNYVFHYTDPPSLLTPRERQPGLMGKASDLRAAIAHSINHSAVHRARQCVTMTHWNAKELSALYSREFSVIHQGGVPKSIRLARKDACSGNDLRIFSICRLTDSKNLDWIIKAVHVLRHEPRILSCFTSVKAIIAGDGPARERLESLAESLGVEEHVSFPGFLSAEGVEEEFSCADLFVVPGRQGFGLPVLEALYREVPVVLNRESRVSELLAGQRWAAVSEDDVDSFVATCQIHVLHFRQDKPSPDELVNLPTEEGWAQSIGKLCGWW